MKRGRIEIMAQILALCIEAKRKTRIMYQTNLSYAQLKAYIALLTSKNLLDHHLDSYVTTDRGYRFLEAMAQLNDVLEDHASKIFLEAVSESYKLEIVRVGRRNTLQDVKKAISLRNEARTS